MKEHVVLLLAVSAFSFLSALPAAGAEGKAEG